MGPLVSIKFAEQLRLIRALQVTFFLPNVFQSSMGRKLLALSIHPAQHSCMHLPFREPLGVWWRTPALGAQSGGHPPPPHESLLVTLASPDISAKSTSSWRAPQVLPTGPAWTPAMGWVGLCRPGSSWQAHLLPEPPSTGPDTPRAPGLGLPLPVPQFPCTHRGRAAGGRSLPAPLTPVSPTLPAQTASAMATPTAAATSTSSTW